MSSSLDESYAWCTALSRKRAGNFYFSFLTVPSSRFRDMCALYAYMRICDDIGDDEQQTTEEREIRLTQWSDDVEAALESNDYRHRALPALADVVHRYRIPREHLYAVIDGVRADLQPVGFETFDDLSHYCYQVAGAVGLCCIHIWGFHDDRALERAVDCGTAFQLTNILRDLGEDAAMGRVYLPAEDLRKFGYSKVDIESHCRDERFERLMRFETARAREYYNRATELFDYLEPPGKPIYAAMLKIYGGLLDEIERRRYDVFTRRVELTRPRKLSIAVGAIVRHRWLARWRSETTETHRPFAAGRVDRKSSNDSA